MTRSRKKKLISKPVVVVEPVVSILNNASDVMVPFEAAPVVSEEPTPQDDAKIIIGLYKDSVTTWLNEAPVASNELTLQWYGTEFQPTYKQWLARGYVIAKQ